MNEFKKGDYVVSNENLDFGFFKIDCKKVYQVIKYTNINGIDAVLLETLDIFYCSAKVFRHATQKEIYQGYKDE